MPGNFHTITYEEVGTWPKPNYVNPSDERTWLPGYSIAWSVIVTAFVFARLYLRVRNRSGAFGLDDVFIIIAWAFSVAFTGAACVSVWYYGIGRHIWDVRPDMYESALFWGWLAQVLFIHSTCACKVSVLLFYRRMAKNTHNKKWTYAVWILLMITIGAWIAIFVAYCFMCSPLRAYWAIYMMMAVGDDNYTCLNGGGITIAAGVLTIASDFWTAALPCIMFQIYDLGVSRRQKIALNTIFCIGFLVTGVGIARTYYLWEMGHVMDISWIGYDLFATSMAECQLAIILCCAPFLRALVRRYMPDLTHNSRGGTRSGTSVTDKDTRWSSHGVTFQPVNSWHEHQVPAQLDGDVPLEPRNEKKGYAAVEEIEQPMRGQYDPLDRIYTHPQRTSHFNATPKLTFESPPVTPYESLQGAYLPPVSPQSPQSLQRTWQNHSYPSPRIR